MLEVIDFAGWVVAIVAAVFGILCWIAMFTDKNPWHIFLGVVAAVIAIIVFTRVYAWLESIGFAIFATGVVLCFLGGACSDTPFFQRRIIQVYGKRQHFWRCCNGYLV